MRHSPEGSEQANDDVSSIVESLLKRVDEAFSTGDVDAALRCADAAHRRARKSPELLEILGRLYLANGAFERAVAALETAATLRPGPDLEAAIVSAMTAAGRSGAAQERLVRALQAFAVDAGDRLAASAADVCRANTAAPAGWVAVSSKLGVWGAIYRQQFGAIPRLVANLPGAFQVLRRSSQPDGETIEFCYENRPAIGSAVSVQLEGQALLGSGLSFPPDPRIDGRSRLVDGGVEGWVGVDWDPRRSPTVIVRKGGEQISASVRPSQSVFGRYDFRAAFATRSLDCASVSVLVEPAAGIEWELPDSPVLVRDPGPPAPLMRAKAPTSRDARKLPIDVIIPVYRGLTETLRCIESVRATTGADARIIVVDDCSPDGDLVAALKAAAVRGEILLVRNPENLGFPGSVNRGITASDERDVVILNADVEVFPGWLGALGRAAYRDAWTGTVTPLSNSGSIASYPAAEASFDSLEARSLAGLAASVNKDITVAVPTAVGFCMYIRRDCLRQTGNFDELAFSKGYGEENDFCIRAAMHGWGHVIAADVYVGHIGGRSFGRRREALLERNLDILNTRYPDYARAVSDFERADPLRTARRRISEMRLRRGRRPTVLLISLGLGGGVERFVAERAAFWEERGSRALILKPSADEGVAEIIVNGDRSVSDLLYSSNDFGELAEVLSSCDVELIEFHHFLDLPPGLIDAALNLSKPYDVYIHDYSWICSRVTMLSTDGSFCSEPALAICERCGASEGARIRPAISISTLRKRSDTWLRNARTVVAPSSDARQRIARYFPGLAIQAAGWEAPVVSPKRASTARAIAKVAVIGAIGEHKGYNVLKACAEDAAARALPLEFVTIGFTEDDRPLMATGKVFVTGEYNEVELDDLVDRESPDLAFFPSIWPETWCFTLTAALRAGLPTVGFDLGAVAERLRASSIPHRLLPVGAGPAEINNALISFAHGSVAPPGSAEATLPAHHHLESRGSFGDAAAIEAPENINARQTMNRTNTQVKVSGELITLNKGLYKLFVRSGAPARVGDDGELLLPAVSLAPAPGVAIDALEIMRGPLNSSDWVCAERDVLIVKIMANSTAVLLTSVCAEGGRPLEIGLERIDQVADKSAAAAPEQRRVAGPKLDPSPAKLAERQGQEGPQSGKPQARRMIRMTVMAHIQNRGDVVFEDAFWAGAPGEGRAIEAFSIAPQGEIAPHQLEYKALTAAGAETPWVSGGNLCGARGTATPLVGFAIRLTRGAEEQFECEYRGAFGSGKIVGPLTNGAPCRSTGAHDPLEAVQLAIRSRDYLETADGGNGAVGRQVGPKFSVFREGAR